MLVIHSSNCLRQNWRRPCLGFPRLDRPLCLLWVISQHQSRCLLLYEMNLWSLLHNTRSHEGLRVHWGRRNSGVLCLDFSSIRGDRIGVFFLPYLDRDVFYRDTERLLAQSERETEWLTVLSPFILHCLYSKNNLISSINKSIFGSINNKSLGRKKNQMLQRAEKKNRKSHILFWALLPLYCPFVQLNT